MFPDVGIQVQGESKRGNAVMAEGRDPARPWTRITGDPGHECFAFRRCLSVHANDRHDLETDHAQALAELSAPLKACTCGHCDCAPAELPSECHSTLETAINLPQALWLEQMREHEEPLKLLKAWVQEPHIDESHTWVQLYKTSPPRGVLKRLSRRLEVSLHMSCQFQGYKALSDFRTQLKRIRHWSLDYSYFFDQFWKVGLLVGSHPKTKVRLSFVLRLSRMSSGTRTERSRCVGS